MINRIFFRREAGMALLEDSVLSFQTPTPSWKCTMRIMIHNDDPESHDLTHQICSLSSVDYI